MMKKRFFFLILSFLGVFFDLHAQIPNTRDSLVLYLKTPRQDSNYVWALNRYAQKLINETAEYDKADSVLKIAEPLALKYGYPLGKYANTRNRATLNYYKTNYTAALRYFQQAANEAERLGLPPQIVYEAHSNIVIIQNQINQYEQAIKTSLKCIEIQEKYHLKPLGSIYSGIGDALKQLKRPQEAVAYLQKALLINKEQKNGRGTASNYNTLGNIYDDLKRPKDALKSYQLALAEAKKVDFLRGQTDYLVNIGRMYLTLGDTEKAILYMKQSLRLSTQLEAQTSVAVAKFNLGQVYRQLNQPQLAEKYYKEALAIAQAQDDKESIKEYQEELGDFYADNASFKQAYERLVAANLTKDSTEKAANKRQLQELVAKYEIQTKEQQIKLLQQEAQIKDQANRFWLVGGVLVLLSVLGLAAWLLNRAKYRRLQESLHLRHKIATDLHDEIGSTLSSISLLSGLTQKQLANEQPQKVAQMVAKINTDARHILESMDDIVWAINPRNDAMTQLLTRLREYAKPLAESKEIRLEFVASPQAESISLPLQVRQNVYLIAKEALNNAFKYAEATKINVEFEVKNDKLTATITDNGVGFETEVLTSRNGLKNMKTRAEEIKATFSIHSHPKEGTKIQLSLKV